MTVENSRAPPQPLINHRRGTSAKAEILRIIDPLELHKLNVLQRHLADGQAWRVGDGWASARKSEGEARSAAAG